MNMRDVAVIHIPIYSIGTLPYLSLNIPIMGANTHLVPISINKIYPFS